MKRILSLLIVILLLPIFGISFCPCAEANPSSPIEFQNAPCKHCCPESRVSETNCKISEITNVSIVNPQTKAGSLRPELFLESPEGLVRSLQNPVRLSGPPPQISHSETYLILQVLRL